MIAKEFKIKTLNQLYLNDKLKLKESNRYTSKEVKFYLENNLPILIDMVESSNDDLLVIAPAFLLLAIQEGELYKSNIIKVIIFNDPDYLNYLKFINS